MTDKKLPPSDWMMNEAPLTGADPVVADVVPATPPVPTADDAGNGRVADPETADIATDDLSVQGGE